jgi:glycosyltransferase involved in cell wall biosynthesis
MKIFMTNNVFPVSRNMSYGGERIVFYLVQELAKRHDVYCFMREGSDFTGIPVKDYIPVEPMNDQYDVHLKAVCDYVDRTGIEPDIYFCGYFGKGSPDMFHRWPYLELTWCRWTHAKFEFPNVEPFNIISYSNILQEDLANSGVPSTMIHYGLPKDLYQFEPKKKDYACWIGKIEGGKAPRIAISLAKAAGIKLVIMGPPYNSGTFWNEVAPHIDNEQIFWVRGVDDQMKQEIMSKAKFFLYSSDNSWREHFGIVFAESLAMGTPVIGMNRINQDCSLVTDKIIEDGKHGLILNYHDSNNLQEILDVGVPLIARIDDINPADCRSQFEERFTAGLMARRYEWFFEQIKDGSRYGSLEVPF